VYDIECPSKETLDFFNLGFYDGEKYWNFRKIEDFLNHVTRKEYAGYRLFAHFGGRFDVHYVFDWLRAHAPEVEMEINCSGSSVISLTVRGRGARLRFTDSYRLLPKSLATLTHEFDVRHKKISGAEFTDRLYNEHDCRGLYEVLEQFFDAFDICSETIASHAMRVFRAKYLEKDIYQPNMEIENFCREAYSGGRCEIFRYDESEVNHYDVNSLYPSAMLESVPVEYLYESKHIPERSDLIGFFKAKIFYPDRYLPILPFHADKLYFPTGVFEGTFSSLDLKLAEREGAEVEILQGKIFLAEPILKEYALSMFALKQEAEREGKKGLRYVYKILNNSLYGKFGQRREQRSYCIDDGRAGLYPLPNGIAYYLSESRAAHILPHIAATITSRARAIQFDLLKRGKQWYTDTDSLFTSELYPVSDALGALHYEGRGTFHAYRLKEYKFNNEYKIKGLPRSKNEDAEKRAVEDKELAEKYLAGEMTLNERMRGWPESIRAGKETVARVIRPRFRREIMDKRARDGQYDTRPWSVQEILAS
jgi:hypothetical protein